MQGGGTRLSDFQPMTSADLSPEPRERSREQRPEVDTGGMSQPAAASDPADGSAPAQVPIGAPLHTGSMQLAACQKS